MRERSAELLAVVSALTEATEASFAKQQSEIRRLETELAKAEARVTRLVADTLGKLVPSTPPRSGDSGGLDVSPPSQGRRVN